MEIIEIIKIDVKRGVGKITELVKIAEGTHILADFNKILSSVETF